MHPRDHPRFRHNQSTPQLPYQQQQQNPPFLPYEPRVPPYGPRGRNREIENLIVVLYCPYGLGSGDEADFRTGNSPDSSGGQNGYVVVYSPESAYRPGRLVRSYRDFNLNQGDFGVEIGAVQREFDSVNHNCDLSSSGLGGLARGGRFGFHNPARPRRNRSIAGNFTLTRGEFGEDILGAGRASPFRNARHNDSNHPHRTIYFGDLPLEEEESPPMSSQVARPGRTQKKDKIREGLAKGDHRLGSPIRRKAKKPSPVRGGLIPIGLLPYDGEEVVNDGHKSDCEGSGSANQNISGEANQPNEGDGFDDKDDDKGGDDDKGHGDSGDGDSGDGDSGDEDEDDVDKDDDEGDDKSKSKRKGKQTRGEKDDHKKVHEEEKAVRSASQKRTNSSTKNQSIQNSDAEIERSKLNSETKKEDEEGQHIILPPNPPPRFRINVQNPENSNIEIRTVSSSELENFGQPRQNQLQNRNNAVANSEEETRWVDSHSNELLHYPEHRDIDRVMEQVQKQIEDENQDSNDQTAIIQYRPVPIVIRNQNEVRNPTVTTVQNSLQFRAGIARQNGRRNQIQVQNEESSLLSSIDGEQQQIISGNDNSNSRVMNNQGQRLQALTQLGQLRGSHPVHSDSEDIRRRNYYQRTSFVIAEGREDRRDSRNSSNRRSYSSRDIPPSSVMSEEQLDLSIGMEESRGSNPSRSEQENRHLRNRSDDQNH